MLCRGGYKARRTARVSRTIVRRSTRLLASEYACRGVGCATTWMRKEIFYDSGPPEPVGAYTALLKAGIEPPQIHMRRGRVAEELCGLKYEPVWDGVYPYDPV